MGGSGEVTWRVLWRGGGGRLFGPRRITGVSPSSPALSSRRHGAQGPPEHKAAMKVVALDVSESFGARK